MDNKGWQSQLKIKFATYRTEAEQACLNKNWVSISQELF